MWVATLCSGAVSHLTVRTISFGTGTTTSSHLTKRQVADFRASVVPLSIQSSFSNDAEGLEHVFTFQCAGHLVSRGASESWSHLSAAPLTTIGARDGAKKAQSPPRAKGSAARPVRWEHWSHAGFGQLLGTTCLSGQTNAVTARLNVGNSSGHQPEDRF